MYFYNTINQKQKFIILLNSRMLHLAKYLGSYMYSDTTMLKTEVFWAVFSNWTGQCMLILLLAVMQILLLVTKGSKTLEISYV